MPRVGGTDPLNFWMDGLYEIGCILIELFKKQANELTHIL